MRDRPDDDDRSAALADEHALTDAQLAFAGALGDAFAHYWIAQQELQVGAEQHDSACQHGRRLDEA